MSSLLNTMLILGMGPGEIVLIALVVLLLFGGKKIPELMRGLGKGIKEFKTAQNGEGDAPSATTKDQDVK